MQNFGVFNPITQAQKYDFLLKEAALREKATSGDTSAQFVLGIALRRGENECVIDKSEGERWLKTAAQNQNSPAGICALGKLYELAIGGILIKNIDTAKQYYTQAIESGYIPAKGELGLLLSLEAIITEKSSGYTTGSGGQHSSTATHTHIDREKMALAISLLTQAAEASYGIALDQLSYQYRREGYGVQKDETQSFRLTQLSAQGGSSYGKYTLGHSYEYGIGTKRDRALALEWYTASSAQGYENASKAVARLKPCCCVIS